VDAHADRDARPYLHADGDAYAYADLNFHAHADAASYAHTDTYGHTATHQHLYAGALADSVALHDLRLRSASELF
jgi:hypothetical protein